VATATAQDAAAVVERLRGAGVRIVRVIHPDLFGRARSKQFPLDALPSLGGGIGYCEASLVESLHGVPLEGGDFPADAGFPDVQSVPDLATARIPPFEPDTAWVLADVRDAVGGSALCSRGTLRRSVGRLAALGLEAIAAAEPEFYLLAPAEGGPGRAYSDLTGMAYTAGRRADPGGALGRIQRALLDLDVGVTAANREFSPGQFEINVLHAPALRAADAVFVLKEAVKDVAGREGLAATFMPKPLQDAEGSSMHVHVSLWRDGANAFDDGGGDLTPLCRAFIAGVIRHAPGLSALAAPTVNSYKRLVPGGLAPVSAGLGGDDRLAYVRIPGDRAGATRVEVRGGDAAANPYLLLAGILEAGRDGIERGLEIPGAPVALPVSLGAAVDALEADETLVAGLGERLVYILGALQRDQVERYRLAVTDWEWREYAFHA
jgi:glutamine synthetase